MSSSEFIIRLDDSATVTTTFSGDDKKVEIKETTQLSLSLSPLPMMRHQTGGLYTPSSPSIADSSQNNFLDPLGRSTMSRVVTIGTAEHEPRDEFPPLTPPSIVPQRHDTSLVSVDDLLPLDSAPGDFSTTFTPPPIGLVFQRQPTVTGSEPKEEVPEESADSDELPPLAQNTPNLVFQRQNTTATPQDEPQDNEQTDDLPPPMFPSFQRQQTETKAENDQDHDDSLPPLLQSGLVFQRQQTIEISHGQDQDHDNNEEQQQQPQPQPQQNSEDNQADDDDTLPPPSGLVFQRQSTVHNSNDDNNDLESQDKEKQTKSEEDNLVGSRSKPTPLSTISALPRTQQHTSEPEISPVFGRVPTDTNPHGVHEDETRKIREIPSSNNYSGLTSPIRLLSTSPLSILPSFPPRQQSHDSVSPTNDPLFQRVPTDTDPHGHT